MRFSERIGKTTPKSDFQIDSMDNDLRNGIWNTIYVFVAEPLFKEATSNIKYTKFADLAFSIVFSFYKEPVDSMKTDAYEFIYDLKRRLFKWDYLGVYDFIDFLASHKKLPFSLDEFIQLVNFILKRELSGYRFINKQLAPITNDNEILEVERAVSNTSNSKLQGARIHLTEALNKISDRKAPDYRNSIKESISAIESLCQVISNDDKAELGKALKIIKQTIPIHGALEQGLLKIYGYTSDGDGIRHALLEETNLDQEDALFMLISCSAFINYMMVKANKGGISFN